MTEDEYMLSGAADMEAAFAEHRARTRRPEDVWPEHDGHDVRYCREVYTEHRLHSVHVDEGTIVFATFDAEVVLEGDAEQIDVEFRCATCNVDLPSHMEGGST